MFTPQSDFQMDQEPIELIRESTRNLKILNRRKNRDEEADLRRSITDIRTDPGTILAIVNKLKTKSSIDVSELQILRNAFIDDVANIQVMLNTDGALRGLVRELTGHQVNKQCEAAGCCCNLALGDSKAGVAVVKAAGPYLVSNLDNLTTELAVTCAWAIGNLAASGEKACEVLTSLGTIGKVIQLVGSSNEEIKDAALYALVRIAYQFKDDLRTEYLHKIFEILPHVDISTTPQLIFFLSCHSDFSSSLLSKAHMQKLVQYLIVCLQTFNDDDITFLFRFLANVHCKVVYDVLLSFLLENNMLEVVRKLSETNESVLWCLGNAYNLCSGHVFFDRLLRL